jgi:transcriptional regulator with XRE-family HTH domain
MFNQRLRELRKQKGISQYDLADQLGLSRGQIANYEQGTREPDYDTLHRFAEYFDVTDDYLLGTEDKIQSNFRNLLKKSISILKDERGMGTPEGIVAVLLKTLELYAVTNGVPLSMLPNVELLESEKKALIKELNNIAEAEDNDPVKEMAEQIRELSPQGQDAIKSMLEVLKTKDDKTTIDETRKHWEPLAAHRDDNPMDDLPEDAIRSMEAAQKAYLDEFKKKNDLL